MPSRAKQPSGKKTTAAKPAAKKAPAKKVAKTAKKKAEPRKRPAALELEPLEPAHLDTPGALAAARLAATEAIDARLVEQSGKYVYCIIQTTEPLRFGRIGIGSEPAD